MGSQIRKCISEFGLELIEDYPSRVVAAQEDHELRLIGRIDKKPVAPQYVWERKVIHKWTWNGRWVLVSIVGE